MVSRVLFLVTLSFSTFVFAQNTETNLVPSDIFTLDTTLYYSGGPYDEWNVSSESYEVPENKIWKIEYISGNMNMYINGKGARHDKFFLTSGDIITFSKNGSCSSNGCPYSSAGFSLSVIEYLIKEY